MAPVQARPISSDTYGNRKKANKKKIEEKKKKKETKKEQKKKGQPWLRSRSGGQPDKKNSMKENKNSSWMYREKKLGKNSVTIPRKNPVISSETQ